MINMKNKILVVVVVSLILASGLIGYQYLQEKNDNSDSIKQDKIPDIKVAIVYEAIIDQIRDADGISDIVAETQADYIHRGFFRHRGFAEHEREHDVYGILRSAIAKIKQKNPDVLIGGALAAQEINRVEYNPLTREVIPENKTWEMALDPQKFGFNMTKEELHEKYWQKTGSEEYIFPDITNSDYQKLLLDFAKKQIDSGMDAIWIDGLYVQAGILCSLAKNEGKDPFNHPAIEASFEAASRIVDEIHKYGRSKGKEIYVGSWSYANWYEMGIPKEFFPQLDLITMSPSAKEIEYKRLNEEEWKEKIRLTKEVYGQEITIIAFIDWAFTADTPLGVFSQTLTKEEANEALRNFDKFFTENEIIFAYPVHGGNLGRDATKLAFGKYRKYDALAPEFQTYETIKELALKKKSKKIIGRR
jgi:hypothetical protein